MSLKGNLGGIEVNASALYAIFFFFFKLWLNIHNIKFISLTIIIIIFLAVAHGILVPSPGMESPPSAVEAES